MVGIEPTLLPWKGKMLPLHYMRPYKYGVYVYLKIVVKYQYIDNISPEVAGASYCYG